MQANAVKTVNTMKLEIERSRKVQDARRIARVMIVKQINS